MKKIRIAVYAQITAAVIVKYLIVIRLIRDLSKDYLLTRYRYLHNAGNNLTIVKPLE